MPTKQTLVIIGVASSIVVLLILILVPVSFSPMEYYEMGFRQTRSTGKVYTEEVYGPGNHHIGPNNGFKRFRTDAHHERYNDIKVFTSDRLEVTMTATMQYFLRPHQLRLLFRDFNMKYQEILRNNTLEALKREATKWSTREFIRERNRVEERLFAAVRDHLGGPCCELGCIIPSQISRDETTADPKASAEEENVQECVTGCLPYDRCQENQYGLYAEVRYFQLGQVKIPEELNNRYIAALILQEETETEKFLQDAELVRKETDRMVKEIENEAEEIRENAIAQADAKVSNAQASAETKLEDARSRGLSSLYTEIGLTNSDEKMSFQYLRTLRRQDNVKIAVDYTHLVASHTEL